MSDENFGALWRDDATNLDLGWVHLNQVAIPGGFTVWRFIISTEVDFHVRAACPRDDRAENEVSGNRELLAYESGGM